MLGRHGSSVYTCNLCTGLCFRRKSIRHCRLISKGLTTCQLLLLPCCSLCIRRSCLKLRRLSFSLLGFGLCFRLGLRLLSLRFRLLFASSSRFAGLRSVGCQLCKRV